MYRLQSATKLADGGGEPFGIWDSHNIPVTPRSLYYTQLTERLGTNALNNVILPKQKTGTIWTELHEWDGNGLFLDELIVLADEETVPATGESLAIRGIVRNLTMLDRGTTNSWRKVYGPGSASFADDFGTGDDGFVQPETEPICWNSPWMTGFPLSRMR